MPFQSEKQRRYLWANEPEIARDWTNTYGSRIKKNNGGLPSIRQPYGGGGDIIQQLLLNWGSGKVKDKAQELGYFPEPTQKKGWGSFLARMLATMFLGPAAGLAWDVGSGIMSKKGMSFGSNFNMPKIGNFNLRSGYGSQRAYEKARQDRRNIKSQHNIIKTLQSGKYAPGWEKTAFDRVQKLGKTLNLVDAADAGTNYGVGLTSKPKVTPRHVPIHTATGSGQGQQTQGQRDTAAAQKDDPGLGGHKKGGRIGYFNRGGLAALWPR